MVLRSQGQDSDRYTGHRAQDSYRFTYDNPVLSGLPTITSALAVNVNSFCKPKV